MEFELCNCGKKAVWLYSPGFSSGNSPFFCDDCVPRGCSCNHRYVNVDAYIPPLDNPDLPTEEDHPIKWIKENEIWCCVDENGREYPCVEYFFDEEGFENEL